jgi:deglycase
MKQVAMVIAPAVFRDEEYAEPKAVLESRGAAVITVSNRPGICIGKLGMEAVAEIDLAEALRREWDAVLFVGGGGSEIFFDDPAAHALAEKALEAGSVLGAICIAPSTLAHAGLLAGRRATAFPSQHNDLVACGATWTGDAVTVDGRVITANGPEAAAAFGEAVARALALPR